MSFFDFFITELYNDNNQMRLITLSPKNLQIASKSNVVIKVGEAKSVEEARGAMKVRRGADQIKKEGRMLDQYLINKPSIVYQIPVVGVMKGKFFYDLKTQLYYCQPDGWWVSEKLDGIRAIWTGQELLTRTGKKLNPPDWWLKGFPPDIALDGELYLGRDQFHQVQSIVMNQSGSDWKKVKYWIFDLPDAINLPFEQVIEVIKEANLSELTDYRIQVVEQQKCRDLSHLLEIQKDLVANGAEGTMLRRPGSCYMGGRTGDLCKFKSVVVSGVAEVKISHLLDRNARIIGYNYDDRRFEIGQDGQKSYYLKSLHLFQFQMGQEFFLIFIMSNKKYCPI